MVQLSDSTEVLEATNQTTAGTGKALLFFSLSASNPAEAISLIVLIPDHLKILMCQEKSCMDSSSHCVSILALWPGLDGVIPSRDPGLSQNALYCLLGFSFLMF